jgi:hypothetical protein
MHGHHRDTRGLTVSDTGTELGAHRHDSRAENWPPATTGPYGSPCGCPLPRVEPSAPTGSCPPPSIPQAVCSPPGWRGSEPHFHRVAAEGWRDLAGGVRLAPALWALAIQGPRNGCGRIGEAHVRGSRGHGSSPPPDGRGVLPQVPGSKHRRSRDAGPRPASRRASPAGAGRWTTRASPQGRGTRSASSAAIRTTRPSCPGTGRM